MTIADLNFRPIIAGLFAAPYYFFLFFILSITKTSIGMPAGLPDLRELAFYSGVSATGVFVIAFAIGLGLQLSSKLFVRIGIGLLLIGGFGLIVAGYYHCDKCFINILTAPDLTDQFHMILIMLSGMAMALAPLFLWTAMRESEKFKTLAGPTLMTGIVANMPSLSFWITNLMGFRLPLVEDLIQRLNLVVILVWIFFVAARMLWFEFQEKKSA